MGRGESKAAQEEKTIVRFLRKRSKSAFNDFLKSLEGLTDPQSWWCAPLGNTGEYLHTSGSILGITLHVASCKIMYTEYAFRDGKLRWQDMSERARQVNSHLTQAIGWLKSAQEFWMRSWQRLSDHDLNSLHKTNWGEDWTVDEIIAAMIHHDLYHAGQIWFVRAQLPKDLSNVRPVNEADLWDKQLLDTGGPL